MSGSKEMPQYQCHKKVRALKIKKIEYFDDASAELTFENDDYAPLKVPVHWTRNHEPDVGGYYVQYDNGHTSYSPAKAFEEGYALI
jgi:hypothetical protein